MNVAVSQEKTLLFVDIIQFVVIPFFLLFNIRVLLMPDAFNILNWTSILHIFYFMLLLHTFVVVC